MTESPRPKRPINTYFSYMADERLRLKEEKPELTGKEISTKLNAAWKEMNEEQKATFAPNFKEDMAEFKVLNDAWKERHPSEEKKKAKKSKAKSKRNDSDDESEEEKPKKKGKKKVVKEESSEEEEEKKPKKGGRKKK